MEIIHCDGFIDMPATAQALYFQILSYCDDEGFTAQLRSCKRNANATDDDVEELIKKRFIYVFDNDGVKVVVVKHWWDDNYIRDGKIVPSSFSERSQVYINPNGRYTLDASKGVPLPPIKNEQKTTRVPLSYRTRYEQGTNKVRTSTDQHEQAPMQAPAQTLTQAQHPIPSHPNTLHSNTEQGIGIGNSNKPSPETSASAYTQENHDDDPF